MVVRASSRSENDDFNLQCDFTPTIVHKTIVMSQKTMAHERTNKLRGSHLTDLQNTLYITENVGL